MIQTKTQANICQEIKCSVSAWPPVVEVEWSHNGERLTELSGQVDTVHMYCYYDRFCGPGADLQPGLGV